MVTEGAWEEGVLRLGGEGCSRQRAPVRSGRSPWPGQTAARLRLAALLEGSVTSWLLGRSWASRPGGQRDPPVWSPLRNASARCPPQSTVRRGSQRVEWGWGSHLPGGPWGRRCGQQATPPHSPPWAPLSWPGWSGRAAGAESSVPASPMPPCPALPWGGPGLAAADTMVGGSPVPSPTSEPVGLCPRAVTQPESGAGAGGSRPPSLPRAARPRDSEHVSVTRPGRNLRPRSFLSLTGAPCGPGLPSQQLACSPTLWPGPGLSLPCAACGHLASPGPRPWAQP